MEKPNLVDQFMRMAEALQKNPAISGDIDIVFNSPATEEELNQAQAKFALTPAMVQFYSQMNGCSMYWEREGEVDVADSGYAAGYINVLPVEKAFGDWKNIIYFGPDDPCQPLHPIDFFIGNACAALYLDGSPNPQVYYYHQGEPMRPLGVDFEGYIQLLLKSRGFWYWQIAIAGPEFASELIPQEEKNFRTIMPHLFPDFQSSDFKRLNAV